MWDTFAFFEWNFRSCYLNLLVNLDRVAVDDLAVQLERYFDPERAFARSRGTDDRNDRVLNRVRAHVPEDSTRKIVIAQMRARISKPPII